MKAINQLNEEYETIYETYRKYEKHQTLSGEIDETKNCDHCSQKLND